MEFIPGCLEAQVASDLYCPSGVGTAYVLEPLASGVWCLLQVESLRELRCQLLPSSVLFLRQDLTFYTRPVLKSLRVHLA